MPAEAPVMSARRAPDAGSVDDAGTLSPELVWWARLPRFAGLENYQMCVLAFAWRLHPRWPLVLIGNRDEAHARPAAPLGRWPEAPHVLGGRDLKSGGTWLGVSEQGRLAVVTNLRGQGPPVDERPSRGRLAREFLVGEGGYARFDEADLADFNPMNLIVAEGGQAAFFTNRPRPVRRPLAAGLYGLSNGDLDAPWPKTRQLKAALQAWIEGPGASIAPLFLALADETRPSDDELPRTGLDLERERLVSPIFIRDPRYGARCSTVVRVGPDGAGEIAERRFGPDGRPSGETTIGFAWPADALAER